MNWDILAVSLQFPRYPSTMQHRTLLLLGTTDWGGMLAVPPRRGRRAGRVTSENLPSQVLVHTEMDHKSHWKPAEQAAVAFPPTGNSTLGFIEKEPALLISRRAQPRTQTSRLPVSTAVLPQDPLFHLHPASPQAHYAASHHNDHDRIIHLLTCKLGRGAWPALATSGVLWQLKEL